MCVGIMSLSIVKNEMGWYLEYNVFIVNIVSLFVCLSNLDKSWKFMELVVDWNFLFFFKYLFSFFGFVVFLLCCFENVCVFFWIIWSIVFLIRLRFFGVVFRNKELFLLVFELENIDLFNSKGLGIVVDKFFLWVMFEFLLLFSLVVEYVEFWMFMWE